MKKKQRGARKFNNLKKSIKDFIIDEEGFVSKENILKIGLGTVAALGLLTSITNAQCTHSSHPSHNNSPYLVQDWPTPNCYRVAVTHASHPSHANHCSY